MMFRQQFVNRMLAFLAVLSGGGYAASRMLEKEMPNVARQNTFHWFNNASVGKTRTKADKKAESPSQGMYVQVYRDKVVAKGQEFSDRSWIDSAVWTVPLKGAAPAEA
ncbi:hypothetical protein ACJ7K1_22285 [Paenibacillus elgii]